MADDLAIMGGLPSFHISASQPLHEALATVLTVLVYPPKSRPTAGLDQRFGELCNHLAIRQNVADEVSANELQLVRPSHAFISPERSRAAEKKLINELEKRRLAGEIALPFVQRALGQTVTLPPGIDRLSKNRMAEYIAERAGISSKENVLSRVFRPSCPVIHFSVILARWMRIAEHMGAPHSPVEAMLRDWDVLSSFVQQAEGLEQAVIDCQDIPVSETSLVRVRIDLK